MKRLMVVVLGLCIVLLLTGSVAAEQYADAAGSAGGSGESGVDPQSPVLNGGASGNYDTLFVNGVNTEEFLGDSDVYAIEPRADGLYVKMVGKTSSANPSTALYCSIPGYQLKTGGVQPRVRYIAVQYRSLGTVGGNPVPEVNHVIIYNGCSYVATIDTTFSSSSCAVQILDLGAYYAFDRGLNIILYISHNSPSTQSFVISAYGARFEW